MANRNNLGGIIHTYQKYDPVNLPAPTQPPPDLVSPAFEHLLMFGDARGLTDEELARAVRLDPSQIAGLGPSLDALLAMLLERKRKILAKFETESVQGLARKEYQKAGAKIDPPANLKKRFQRGIPARAAPRPGDALVFGRGRAVAVRPADRCAGRAPGQQVPGR